MPVAAVVVEWGYIGTCSGTCIGVSCAQVIMQRTSSEQMLQLGWLSFCFFLAGVVPVLCSLALQCSAVLK
jgi:hypothetical protein